MFEEVCGPGDGGVTVAAVQQADPLALAAALTRLSEQQIMDLSAEQAECVVAATQRVINAMAARQAVAVHCYSEHVQAEAQRWPAGRAGGPQVICSTAASLAAILRIAPRTMATRVHAARWGGLLPATSALAWAGDLEPYRVASITAAAQTLGVDDVVEFEARLYDRDIRAMAASRVKQRAVKVAARLASRTAAPDPVLPRWVRVAPGDTPGTSRWSACLPTERSQRMWAALSALAQEYRRANPAVTLAQARADALVDLMLGTACVSTEVTIVLPADLGPYGDQDPAGDGDQQAATEQAAGGQTTDTAPAEASSSDTEPGGAQPRGMGDCETARGAEQTTDPTCDEGDLPRPGPHRGVGDWTPEERNLPSGQQASGGDQPRGSAQLPGTGLADTDTQDSPGQTCDGTGLPRPWPASRADAGEAETAGAASGEGAGSAVGRPVAAVPATRSPHRSPRRSPGRAGRPTSKAVAQAWADIHWIEGLLWDASPVERRVGSTVAECARVDVNPCLDRDLTGERVWFVPGPVLAPGIGVLLPAHVTKILADPDVRVRLARAHPDTGAVDALHEKTYRPGAALARLVRARDGTCRFPGCATPADRCHLDHVVRYPDGPTTSGNLQSLCATHHGFKHHAGWTVTMTDTGICTWTAPTGRTHTTHPHAIHDQAA